MKQYADVKQKARHTVIQVGDRVLLRQRKQKKFPTNFDPKPFRVTRKRGNMITAFRNGKYVTRSSSLFKKVNLELFEERRKRVMKTMMILVLKMTRTIVTKLVHRTVIRTIVEMKQYEKVSKTKLQTTESIWTEHL